MSENEDRDATLSLLAGIGIGAIIGAVAALLLAPKAGADTREGIKTAVSDLRTKSEQLFSDWSAAMEEQLGNVRKLYDEAKLKLEQAVESGKKVVTRKKEESQQEEGSHA